MLFYDFSADLDSNLNAAAMLMAKVKALMAYCLLAIVNLLPIRNLCIFGIQYVVGRTFIFSGIDFENCCLISLMVESVKMFFL